MVPRLLVIMVAINSMDSLVAGSIDNITIGTDGTVTAITDDQAAPVNVGQITLVDFINPQGLQAIGNNLFNFRTAFYVLAGADEPLQTTSQQRIDATLAR